MRLGLVGRAVLPFYYRRVTRFLRDARRATEIQRELLLEKVRRHAESDFGRQHGFAAIRSVEDFRRRVPVAPYGYYQPYLERVKRGDFNAMFAPGTKVLMFALTSGTTSASKFIPVTSEFLAEYRRGWFIWGARNYRDHIDQMRKQSVQLASNWQLYRTEGGTWCGNISGLAQELSPRIARLSYITPLAVTKIIDPAAKHYTALRIAMAARSVGMIITANPSTLLELARRADACRESLIRDIFDGTLSPEVDVSGEIRDRLRWPIGRRNRGRARELERLANRHGALRPKDFWPRLSLLCLWLGGSVGAYLPLLAEYYGQTALRDHGLSASEGRMTIPIHDNTSAGLLEYVNHYFEFIPEAEHGSENPIVLEAHELEEGKNYFILLTTSAGLYRYDIHDVVRCVGFEGSAPLLEFLSKGAHFSSVTGEKLSEFQVVAAVKASLAELQVAVEHFTLAPIMEQRAGYVLLIEREPSGKEEELARRVEFHLARLNSEYADKLRSGRLLPLAVRLIPAGTWHAFRQRRIGQRGNLEEYKHPCLVGDLEFVKKLGVGSG
jgi:hypothetical protein